MASPAAAQEVQLRVQPEPVQQGGILFVEVTGTASVPLSCEWQGRSYRLYPEAGGLRVALAVDRQAPPGPAELLIGGSGEGAAPLARRTVEIVALDTGPVQIIRLPPSRMALQKDPRLAEESRRIGEMVRTQSPQQLWRGLFQAPVMVKGIIGHNFGRERRYVEIRPRARKSAKALRKGTVRKKAADNSFTSYHRGMDFSLEPGTPVPAANAGRVLAAERFVLPGNAVFLDHGQGIITAYFHLSAIRVKPGEMVTQGQVVGAVGNTGRSTGPHLHWSAWVQGQAVNPAALTALPERFQ